MFCYIKLWYISKKLKFYKISSTSNAWLCVVKYIYIYILLLIYTYTYIYIFMYFDYISANESMLLKKNWIQINWKKLYNFLNCLNLKINNFGSKIMSLYNFFKQ